MDRVREHRETLIYRLACIHRRQIIAWTQHLQYLHYRCVAKVARIERREAATLQQFFHRSVTPHALDRSWRESVPPDCSMLQHPEAGIVAVCGQRRLEPIGPVGTSSEALEKTFIIEVQRAHKAPCDIGQARLDRDARDAGSDALVSSHRLERRTADVDDLDRIGHGGFSREHAGNRPEDARSIGPRFIDAIRRVSAHVTRAPP